MYTGVGRQKKHRCHLDHAYRSVVYPALVFMWSDAWRNAVMSHSGFMAKDEKWRKVSCLTSFRENWEIWWRVQSEFYHSHFCKCHLYLCWFETLTLQECLLCSNPPRVGNWRHHASPTITLSIKWSLYVLILNLYCKTLPWKQLLSQICHLLHVHISEVCRGNMQRFVSIAGRRVSNGFLG
jgi:hypothetical protein